MTIFTIAAWLVGIGCVAMRLGIASILFGLIVMMAGDDGALYEGAHIVGGIVAIVWGMFVISKW